jgi:BirA family biotin operon repressor/biotin-[acetyl-CoA-carboxylase] ligase
MKVVKVDAISSTNESLKSYVKTNDILSPCSIVADRQYSGRGQRGTTWQSEPGKNLTFSVFLPHLEDFQKQGFKLSALVALALYQALNQYNIPKLAIKWPNDILSRRLKVAGILIESLLHSNGTAGCVIGIGLNVNQLNFEGLPKASSLKMITGKSFDLNDLLHDILLEIEKIPLRYKNWTYPDALSHYYTHLFNYNKINMFEFPDGTLLQGIQKGVDDYGRLIVEFEEGKLESFDVKEIQIKY